ncbi:tail assembly chaperone [Planomicrobium okeanokoites]|uniref:tail assembly chaperone n=1 Tax=Planomicrobium okeanokoites TaxID=244 RepID=UPI000A024DB2|nr:tail assembly chaperone [Planomicrobium okeanokoites]
MTAFLKIDGKEHEAKCTFRFSKLADKKYSKKKEKESDPDNGFGSIFGGLIEFDNNALVAFWDCALDYSPKDKPKIEEIEAALEARFEEDGGTEDVFKEAFRAVDESAFFGKQVQKYWKNVELMKDYGSNEEEKEKHKKMYDHMVAARKEIED